MRLIDADALKARKVYSRDLAENVVPTACIDWAETIDAAPRWHGVEEPPKEEGRYWFAVWFDGHWIFDAAWYTHDISTVIDVLCCERVGGFYKGNTEVHPDYWMPIEPPKEVQE